MSERKVVKAIERGARTADQVGAACGAGTRCGGCRPTIDHLLDHHVDHHVDHRVDHHVDHRPGPACVPVGVGVGVPQLAVS